MPHMFLIQCPVRQFDESRLAYHEIGLYCRFHEQEMVDKFRRQAKYIAHFRHDYPAALNAVHIASTILGLDSDFIVRTATADFWCKLKPSGIIGMPLRSVQTVGYFGGVKTETVTAEKEDRKEIERWGK